LHERPNNLYMKHVFRIATTFILSMLLLCSCGNTDNSTESVAPATDSISIGFSQLGAESDWRSANTDSMKSTFSQENGYELTFEDGQQKQSKQITAIRSFIQKGVDYIVLAPVTQNGWDSVLQEAKDANIPVIIVDRMVEVQDESLFTCWVGSDFLEEGRKASEWLHEYTVAYGINPSDIHIVDIQGTLESSAQIGRTKGLEEGAEKYGWDLRCEMSGEFTQAKGREIMAQMLVTFNNINVVYCENDNEALGAIEAIESAGKHAGSDIKNGDIMVLSFDGVNKDAMEYVLNGTISCIVECNPLHGPRVESIIRELEQNENPDKFEYVNETLYSTVDKVEKVIVDGKEYPVTMLTQDIIDSRDY